MNTNNQDYISKSQKKRDADELQTLGVRLAELSAGTLEQLNLPESLLQALIESKKIQAHGALRRHRQYIGKLMRQVDPEPLLAFLELQQSDSAQQTAWLHRIERLREQLLANDDALSDWMRQHPESDSQILRQLIRKARQELKDNKPPKAYRELFQFIKQHLPSPEQAHLAKMSAGTD